MMLRVIGFILLALGLAAFGWDAAQSTGVRDLHLSAAGELWYALSPATLNLAQAVTQRYVLPWLWDPVMITVLLWPAALVLGVPGLLLLATSFRRRRLAGHSPARS